MDTSRSSRLFSRRRILAGGAASGALLLLAACGGTATTEAMPKEEMKEAEAPKAEAKQPEMEKISLASAIGDQSAKPQPLGTNGSSGRVRLSAKRIRR